MRRVLFVGHCPHVHAVDPGMTFCTLLQGLSVLRKLIEVGAVKINGSFLHPSVALLRLYPQVGFLNAYDFYLRIP